MQLAVNFSRPAADLQDAGLIAVNRFKVPMWPELIAEVSAKYPAYVHFPLRTTPTGVINTEHDQPADLDQIARLRDQTETPFVNIHLLFSPADYPDRADDQVFIDDATRCIETLTTYFGADHVIVENVPETSGPAMQPAAITQIIERTGAGLLLDISHARIAADVMGVDPRAYLAGLPLDHIREIHVTGLQRVTERDRPTFEALGREINPFLGRLVDHIPFTEDDWTFLGWCFEQIRTGGWQAPALVSFEYGGIGGMWGKLVDRDTLAAQVPRLQALVQQSEPVSES